MKYDPECFSHGIHVSTKDADHSRRTNREVFVPTAWVSDTVCTSDAGIPGVITSCSSHTFLMFLQLIIPEAFRALPAFILALQKTKPLKGATLSCRYPKYYYLSPARQVSSDVRNYHIHRILSMSPRTLMNYLYPRLVALHDLDNEIALPQMLETPEGTVIEKVRMPSCIRSSYFFMEANGVYLIGEIFVFLMPIVDISVIIQIMKKSWSFGLAQACRRRF